MPEYVYSILAIVAVMGLTAWWIARKRNDVWKGELVKKKFNSGDIDSPTTYYLIFKTDEGKRKRFNVGTEKAWNEWDEGDRAEKRKGEFFPSKV